MQAGVPSEQPEFCDLFAQPKKFGESSNFLEEIIPSSSSENVAYVNLWEEGAKLESELKIEAEDLLSSNASDRFVDEVSATEVEATTANELNVYDNSLNTEETPSSLFDDFWDEQLDLDLTPVSEISLSTELPKSEEISTKAPLIDDSLVTNELGLVLDTTETDFFNSLGEENDQNLNLLFSAPVESVVTETLSDLNEDVSTAKVVDDEFGELDALLGEANTDEFAQLDALLDSPEAPVIQAAAIANISTSEVVDEEFGELDALLGEANTDEFGELDALLGEANTDEFGELDALLGEANTDEFGELDALLDSPAQALVTQPAANIGVSNNQEVDDFNDLEKLLGKEKKKSSSSPKVKSKQAKTAPTKPRRAVLEQTMKVPVKHLDNVSNLVGELVVNRNSLEQDQQRMRQSVENLLHQVQTLNGLGSRMQELYERSLMEASLNNIRQGSRPVSVNTLAPASERHASGMDFDALEMDRFTGFHTLSQEMIELIVRVREASSDIEFVTDDTEQVARQFRQVTTQLQEGLTRSRMLPFAQIAERLPRAVRDISLKYGKQAELQIEGQESLIDKVILEQLYDPMTHLVNNSITHGIESPEERVAKGKPPVGKITIKAFHQGNQTVISVSDDGAGIDSDKVMTKAIQKGIITLADTKTMSRLDAYNLLFHAGFSMKEQVDEFAGRGVGMDVVKTSLNEIRGTITTDSTLGKGTTFTIRLPLTLSIGKALCCVSDKAQIAFPMDGVEDMMDISPQSIVSNEEGQSCISWRDSLLPFRPLKELLVSNRQVGRSNLYGASRDDDMISIVVLRSPGALMAIQVDQVLGEQEIVIKQFEGPAPKPVGVAGATVMGDGRVMPIADVLELIDLALGRLQREGGNSSLWTASATPMLPEIPDAKTEPMVLIIDDSITVRELLSMTFNKAGYRVEQARDGQEAWDKLRDGLPCDLVFCDIEMPRMDGLELLSRMQKDPNLSNLPIAMLTSRGADRHRQMAVQLGASGYFTKPYLEEVLLDGAQRMLNGEVLVAAKSVV
ncbi:MAG: hybrid sensor histidine kinase/response regulator [Gloeocapsa sp. UFS-A4-WI-NPMV-4B04]|nr:hybrid sensor histidine kinase/response regulator [Gloeocapsa sp. UFS-A4-WI-NPMV-4B04]